MPFSINNAHSIVIDWLRSGGKHTELVPVDYDFHYPYIHADEDDGSLHGCAGAVMLSLHTFGDCRVTKFHYDTNSLTKFGRRFFYDSTFFFNMGMRGVCVDDPNDVADYLEQHAPYRPTPF